MKNQPRTTKKSMKNHENRPRTMKNKPGTMIKLLGTMKNHENRPETKKSHENRPETMKKTPDGTLKNHEN